MVNGVILVVLLCLAVWCDAQRGRIPNVLTIGGVVAGLCVSLMPGNIGAWEALGGLAIGLVALLPLYAVRAMGAADVKLMAAAGSLLGAQGALAAAIYTLALGGLLAIGIAWKAHVVREVFSHLRFFAYASAARLANGALPQARDVPLTGTRAPYALAIAGGVLMQQLTWLWLKGAA